MSRKPKPLERPLEKALRKIVFATQCRYEGHESMCNPYGCTVHDHTEVNAVRVILRALSREQKDLLSGLWLAQSRGRQG